MIKQIIFVALIALIFAQDVCTQKLITECENDSTKAYEQCDKAAKEKGADQTADINCLKFLLSARKECWPCICEVAKKQGWKIKGCKLMKMIIDAVNNMRTN